MRLKLENGFYRFYPYYVKELELLKAEGFDVVPCKDFFTFPFLATLKNYSIEGQNYHDLTAKITYSGRIEELFLKNNFVYDLESKTLKNINAVSLTINETISDFIYFDKLPQAGGFMRNKKRLKSFSGRWLLFGSAIIVADTVEYYENT
ncbi:MAG: hypothetical protein LBD46_06570 [Endomicrobium sp.]|jgi:hypothetical protein|nr:hypothetical protein [Endomicrobium sp.]